MVGCENALCAVRIRALLPVPGPACASGRLEASGYRPYTCSPHGRPTGANPVAHMLPRLSFVAERWGIAPEGGNPRVRS